MALHRRRLLALLGAGSMPALAGCTPCGETWTGVGFAVEPLSIERAGGWRVEARIRVDFDFGREGYGLTSAALALFDDEGAVLAESPVGDLTWREVPDDERRETDCGDYGSLTREATLESGTFPRWVGLRYDRFSTSYASPTTVARYPSSTPDGTVRPSDYDSTAVEAARVDGPPVEPDPPVTDVRFDAGPLRCEERTPEAEARTNVFLGVRADRAVPAEHYHPVLAGLSLADTELTLDVGVRPAPRFRRGECRRSWWTAGVDVDRPADLPETVRVRNLDRDGEPSSSRRIDVTQSSE